MYSKESKVNFSMSYAELSGVSKQRANTILRDIAEFENYGISEAEILAFKAKVAGFDSMRIDEDYRGLVMQATQDKDELADRIRGKVRELATFIRRTYSTKSGAYARLKLGNIAKLNDLKLYRTVNSFCYVSRSLELELTANIADRLSILEDLNMQFNALIEEKSRRIEERDIATLNRVLLANEIYNQFSEYSRIGQVIWAESNEAKYNDYVIYGSSKKQDSSPPENADEGEGDLPNG